MIATPLCRFSIDGREHTTKALASGRPLLFVFWHGQITPMVLYFNRFWDPTQFVMVTLGGDDRGVIWPNSPAACVPHRMPWIWTATRWPRVGPFYASSRK
jgi:hypothetical protein